METINYIEEDIQEKEDIVKKLENENQEKGLTLILKFIKNFKIGKNVTNIQIPVALIQPKTTLKVFSERFYQNFDYILDASYTNNDFERMSCVHRYSLSIFDHVNVTEKPINSVLGETLMGNFIFKDKNGKIHKDNYYCTEQISHHPLIFTGIVYNQKEGIMVNYTYNLNMIFMGTSIKVELNGSVKVKIEKFNETYTFTAPDMNGRFIRGFSEYGGDAELSSDKSNFKIISKFHSKPLIGGIYDHINSKVIKTDTKEEIYNIKGQWSKEMKIKKIGDNDIKLYYNRAKTTVLELNEDRSLLTDSENVWKGVIDAHNEGNNKLKSMEKNKVEQHQRNMVIERKKNNLEWEPKHFIKINNDWDLIEYK